MRTTQQYHRLVTRLSKSSEREAKALMRELPKELKERVAGVTIRFTDRPTPAMIERGTSDDALSVTDREAGEIIVFVMNLNDRYAAVLGAFREELKRVLVTELAEWAGAEWVGQD